MPVSEARTWDEGKLSKLPYGTKVLGVVKVGRR